MACKHLPFYNVEASVGKGGINRPDDVLLVQYMLSKVGKVPPHPFPPPVVPLAADGMASPLLVEWILWFQNCCKTTNHPVIADGRIDPSRPGNAGFYPAAHGRTMLMLNVTFRRRFRTAHDALENDPTCPASLQAKFTADAQDYQ